jgi:hypothetical protein
MQDYSPYLAFVSSPQTGLATPLLNRRIILLWRSPRVRTAPVASKTEGTPQH